MPSFGTTSSAGTSPGGATNLIVATKYTLPVAGLVTKLSVYSPSAGNVKGGIYTDSSGVPGTLVIANNTGVACSAGAWTDVPITPTFLSAGTYWLAFINSANNMRAFIAAAVNQAAYNTGTTYAGGLPGTFPTPIYQNVDYVSYGTYYEIGPSNMQPESPGGEATLSPSGAVVWEAATGEIEFPSGGGGDSSYGYAFPI